MSQAFDKYKLLGAYHYQWYGDPNWAWYKECVDRCVEFCKGNTVDIGCGEGLLVDKITQNGFEAVGIEPDPNARQLANPDLDIRQGSVYDGFMGDWEYLACLNVIEHLERPERIKELIDYHVTKGAIIITDKPTGQVGRYHEHEFTKAELLELFKGLKPKYFEIKSTEFGKPITFHGIEVYK